MTFHPPGPFVTFFPPKQLGTEVHLEIAPTLHANSCEDVLLVPGKIDASERIRKAYTIVGEEQRPCLEYISAAHGVAWADGFYRVCVVSSAVGVLEELAEVVQVKAGTHSVPAG